MPTGLTIERALRLHYRAQGIHGAPKGEKERITMGIYFSAVPPDNCCAQQLSLILQHRRILVLQAVQQLRRAFDVSKEKGDRACRKIGHHFLSLSTYQTPGTSRYLTF